MIARNDIYRNACRVLRRLEADFPTGEDIYFHPETIDGVRACMEMQKNRLEAVALTNKYLGLK